VKNRDLIEAVFAVVPEAIMVDIAECGMRCTLAMTPETRFEWIWECKITVPRRAKNGRKLAGTEPFSGHGETAGEAVEGALEFIKYIERDGKRAPFRLKEHSR
jgi:hypothetical protein